MNLAIKGHSTRSKEVLELLKMIGGKNFDYFTCNYPNKFYYVLDEYIHWNYIDPKEINKYVIFTLEEFLEKFPYKVGDRVKTIYGKIGIISKPIWSTRDNCIRYELEADTDSFYFVNELQPHNEKTMDRKYNVETYLKVWDETEKGLEVVVNDKFELKEDNGKFYIIKKQPQYPKTYEECCSILNLPHSELTIDVPLRYSPTLIYLTTLLICHDAYWKIAGEQMGLGKPWEPDYKNPDIDLYVIINIYNRVEKAKYGYGYQHCILSFPTEEMRDAFYENFKDLIEQCKEFL